LPASSKLKLELYTFNILETTHVDQIESQRLR
jgi:hypothetical protein